MSKKKEILELLDKNSQLSPQDIAVMLGIDEETASEDACKIEHVLSEKTFNALKKLINK